MKLIVGLGNPGLKYKNSRHNIGFLVIEKLAKELGIKFNKKQEKGLLGQGKVNSQKLVLLKPLTYMNLSGLSIRAVAVKNKIPPQNLLVISDDVNLKVGTLRLRDKGSDGGHKGLKSIVEEIGTNQFSRLRLGVGKDNKNYFLSDFVLAPFTKLERKIVNKIIDTATQACISWVNYGPEVAMNRFNKDWANLLD